MKKLYWKFLIWFHGPFRTRITRCQYCKFRIFNNDPEAYGKMLRHKLYGHCTTVAAQMVVLEREIEETKHRLLKNILGDEL